MRLFSKAVLIALCLFFSGCATQAKYQAILATWVGHPTDELISKWGPPTSTTPLTSGGSVLEYSKASVVRSPGYSYSIPMNTYQSGTASVYGSGGYAYGNYSGTATQYVPINVPPSVNQYWCKTRFTTDKGSVIRSWAHEGNVCVSK